MNHGQIWATNVENKEYTVTSHQERNNKGWIFVTNSAIKLTGPSVHVDEAHREENGESDNTKGETDTFRQITP